MKIIKASDAHNALETISGIIDGMSYTMLDDELEDFDNALEVLYKFVREVENNSRGE